MDEYHDLDINDEPFIEVLNTEDFLMNCNKLISRVDESNLDTFLYINRIIPIARDNLKAYLKGMELDEYEPISIMHRTLAMNVTDCYWVKFNPTASFDKNHPRGSHYECPFYNHNNLYSKVNPNGEFI